MLGATMRLMRKLVGFAVVAGIACHPNVLPAQTTPKAAPSGAQLAQQYCSQCHVVMPDGKRGWTDAPSFDALARRDGQTVAKLAAVMQKPHMKMMNTERPPDEANAIARYIMSLRNR